MGSMRAKKILFFTAVLIIMTAFCACLSTPDALPDPGADSWKPLFAKAEERQVLKTPAAIIDISNKNQGYLCVKYLGNNPKVKFQLTKDNETYTYNILKRKEYEIFPFSAGSGTYTAGIFENISDNQYSQACAETIQVKLDNENLPFLYPNEYVNYAAHDEIISLSYKVAQGSTDSLKKVESIFSYVTQTIDYDYDLAEHVSTDYLPHIEQILKKKKGICFDYASVMCAMLRIQGIPAKLVVGYAGDVYHAWISVYIREKGWVDGIIQFNGKDWTMMDPTTAASSGQADDITEDSRYNALYFY